MKWRRVETLESSKEAAKDPSFYFPDNLNTAALAEGVTIVRIMGTGDSIPVSWVDSWFGKEKIPAGWTKPATLYGPAQTAADITNSNHVNAHKINNSACILPQRKVATRPCSQFDLPCSSQLGRFRMILVALKMKRAPPPIEPLQSNLKRHHSDDPLLDAIQSAIESIHCIHPNELKVLLHNAALAVHRSDLHPVIYNLIHALVFNQQQQHIVLLDIVDPLLNLIMTMLELESLSNSIRSSLSEALTRLMTYSDFVGASAENDPLDLMMSFLGFSSRELTNAYLHEVNLELAENIKRQDEQVDIQLVKDLSKIITAIPDVDFAELKSSCQSILLQKASEDLFRSEATLQSLWESLGGKKEMIEWIFTVQTPESLNQNIQSTLDSLRQRSSSGTPISEGINLFLKQWISWIRSGSQIQGKTDQLPQQELILWYVQDSTKQWAEQHPESREITELVIAELNKKE